MSVRTSPMHFRDESRRQIATCHWEGSFHLQPLSDFSSILEVVERALLSVSD